ncbi:unannotated protein [freshwater metagenome]|uniref:Unannotated protein n=1 Tax=freshwater metagenome TaxID=449393 RepID=A0A6J7IX60_9ZZZZ
MNLPDLLVSVLGPLPTDRSPLNPSPAGESRSLIGGRLVAGGTDIIRTLNPATGEPLGEVHDCGMAEAQLALTAARSAFDTTRWSTDVDLRRHCLSQLQEALRAEADEYRAALVAEIGCPVRMTYADQYDYAVDKIGFFIDLLGTFEFRRDLPATDLGDSSVERYVSRVPAGVVSAITPWNLPLELILAKVAGALAAGCTMVVKPSPLAPWAGTILGRLIAESTDIPAGVINIIASSSLEVAQLLTTAPEVDAVAFTGSTATGRAVMAAAAERLTHVSLELGGKSAAIVLDDADLVRTVPFVAGMACFNAGQSCIMPSRLLVPRAHLEECVELAAEGMRAVRVGDPRSPDTFMGPLISAAHLERVQASVEGAVAEGARVVTGGGRPADLPRGNYFSPTLIADAAPDSAIVRDEVFGPVVVIAPHDGDDDAVRLSNGSDFGLAAYVWSSSSARAVSVSRRLGVGMVGINGGMFTGADMPFGGRGHSGIGREWGIEGLEEFLEVQTTAIRRTKD